MRAILVSLIALAAAASPLQADSFEPNDTIAEAYGPLASGIVVESMISTEGDVDWYNFDADAGDLSITLTDIPAGTDYDVCLADQEGNFLVPCSDAEGNADERIDYLLLGRGRFWIRVRSASGYSAALAYRLTATFVTIVNPPSVALLSPDGGESWTAGTWQAVEWTAEDPEDGAALSIDLDLSLDDGGSWTPLAAGIANTGSWQWQVPESPTEAARLRVTARDSGGAAASDTSAAAFRILSAPGQGALALAGDASGPAGGIVLVPLTLANDHAVAELEARIALDPLEVAFLDASVSPRAGSMQLSVIQENASEWRLVLSGGGTASIAVGEGEIAALRLRVDHFADAGDTTALPLFGLEALDTGAVPMVLTATPGRVTVTEALVAEVHLSAPADLHADPGAPLEVPITLRSNLPLSRLEFSLQTDAEVLGAPSVIAGPSLSALAMEATDLGSGALRVVFAALGGAIAPPDTGILCVITFTAAQDPPRNAGILFGDLSALGPRGEVLSVTATGAQVTPVRILELTAREEEGGVRVAWRVADREAAIGYRVLRSETGAPGPVHAGLLDPSEISYLDGDVLPGARYRYWLEALGRDGTRELFGPSEVEIRAGGLRAGLPYPNPARSSVALDLRAFAGGGVRAAVVDPGGRVLREIAVAEGASTVQWDGRMAGGAEAPAGIYFLLVTQGSERVQRRVVKLGG